MSRGIPGLANASAICAGIVMTNVLGPDDPERLMWEMTLSELLGKAVDRNPDKVFLEISGQKFTYRQFQRLTAAAAGMFRAMGLDRGDRVCLLLPNCPEFLLCWFGLSTMGAICVPINTAYKRDEAAYIMNNSGARMLVAHSSLLPVAGQAAALATGLQWKLVIGARSPPGDGWLDFSDRLARGGTVSGLPEVSPDDISMLVYTSGTTGNPKGVMVPHKMYVAAGQGFAHWTQASSEDRFFTCLPYFHANTHYYSTMGTLATGATLVVADRFSASRFWGQVREARATVANFIGMMMPILVKQPESPTDKQHSVRLFYGSPAYSPEFLQAFQERFDTGLIVGFGMTETCYGTIEGIREERRHGSSGRARQHPDPRFRNQVTIVDDRGATVPPGTVGEICIKNPALMLGYWGDDEQTRLSLRDGWLYAGDLARMDEDGYLYFVDRKKDVIRRRGENISSLEVEDVIKRHSGILDCAVIGVPSELGEEEVKAYVVRRPGSSLTPEDVVFWCAERLAYFKVPRYIEFREGLPRTPSLRVRKDLLRRERSDLIRGCFDRDKAGISLR